MLTPPHSTSARGSDNLHYHYHDLVAISMGTGGWVFKIKSRLGSPAKVLEPKCHGCDIEVKHAGYGIDMCVLTCDISGRQPNQGPPKVNDVLTPRACLTLLAYTLTLGEPYSVQPFFVLHCPHCWSSLIDHFVIDLRWVRHRNLLSDRVSAGLPLHSTPQCTLNIR